MRRSFGQAGLVGARWALYASVLAPLVYSTEFVFPFVVPGALWFRLTVAVAGGLAAVALLTGTVRVGRLHDPVLGAMVALLVISLVAALAGDAVRHSVFGSYERMGGVVAWAHYAAYYLLLRLLLDERGWTRYLLAMVASVTTVAALGALQAWGGAAGLHPLFRIGRAQATMGNPGFLSVLLILGLAGCGLLARRLESRPERIGLAAAALLQASVLFLSTIRTTLVALLAGVLAGAVLLAVQAGSGRMKRWAWSLAGVAIVLAVGLAVGRETDLVRSIPTVRTAAATTLDDPSIQTRLVAWKAGIEGVRDAPLLGVGPENFRLVHERYLDPRIHEYLGQAFRMSEAHNDYLEAAVETGLPGGLAFLLLWVLLGARVVRAVSRSGRSLDAALLGGCFAAYAVVLLVWFRTPNTFSVFVGLAAFSGFTLEKEAPWLESPGVGTGGKHPGWPRKGLAALGLVLGVVAAGHTVALARPARALVDARQTDRLPARVENFEEAARRRVPGTQEVAIEYGRFAADLRPAAVRGADDEGVREAARRAYKGAAESLAREVDRDPKNPRLRALAAHVAFNRFRVDGDSAFLERGIKHAARAVERSPVRPRYPQMLSELLMTAGRPDSALEVLRAAAARLPAEGKLPYTMAKIHAVEGRIADAEERLLEADSLGWSPAEPNRAVYAEVARSLLAAGDTARAQRVLGLAGGRFTFD